MTWVKDRTDPTRLTEKDLRGLFRNQEAYSIADKLLNSFILLDPSKSAFDMKLVLQKESIQKLVRIGCSINIKPCKWKESFTQCTLTATFYPEFVNGINFLSLTPTQLVEFGFIKIKLNPVVYGYMIPYVYFKTLPEDGIYFSLHGGLLKINKELKITFELDKGSAPTQSKLYSFRTFSYFYALKYQYLNYALLPYGKKK